jgi:prepilin-type N-terminal cleavage/methylation domain-containing protein
VSARGEAGFTLLELLVAAVLIAMVAALGASGLRFGVRAWERAEAVSEAEIEARALRRFLTALIEGARPIRYRDGSREPPALFLGEPRGLIAAADLPGRLAPPGPHLVGLEVDEGPAGAILALRWRALGAARPALRFGPGDAREVLAEGLSGVAFRYVGAGGAEARWAGRPTPPALVEIDLAWGADGPAWPTLAAAPRAVP